MAVSYNNDDIIICNFLKKLLDVWFKYYVLFGFWSLYLLLCSFWSKFDSLVLNFKKVILLILKNKMKMKGQKWSPK